MTQDERWNKTYDQYMQFMEETKHRPSKHRPAEHALLNWYKFNRKLMLHDRMLDERRAMFEKLQARADQLRRLNQYAYKEPNEQKKN